jgi:hypothetical protein
VTKLKLAAVSLLFGILGVLLVFAAQHAYTDHQNLHALVDLVVKQQQAAQKAAGVPQAAPAPEVK